MLTASPHLTYECSLSVFYIVLQVMIPPKLSSAELVKGLLLRLCPFLLQQLPGSLAGNFAVIRRHAISIRRRRLESGCGRSSAPWIQITGGTRTLIPTNTSSSHAGHQCIGLGCGRQRWKRIGIGNGR